MYSSTIIYFLILKKYVKKFQFWAWSLGSLDKTLENWWMSSDISRRSYVIWTFTKIRYLRNWFKKCPSFLLDQQLGPVVKSVQAQYLGLKKSMIERLIKNFDLYSRQPDNGKYNEKYVIQLTKNYRSHPKIIEMSNILFYDR